LFDRGIFDFGPWWCGKCNHRFRGKILGDKSIEITEVTLCDTEPKLCLLKLRDLYVVVEGYCFAPGNYDEYADYKFHSSQCPSDLMRSVMEVFDVTEGQDPHGIFRFVASVPDNEEYRKRLEGAQSLLGLFLVFHTNGQPIPSEYQEEVTSNLAALQMMVYCTKSKTPSA
jgi:hypothetical protein